MSTGQGYPGGIRGHFPGGHQLFYYHQERQFLSVGEPMNLGKVAAWIYVHEDKGRWVKR